MRAHGLLQIYGLSELVYAAWELVPRSVKLISSPAESGRLATPRAAFDAETARVHRYPLRQLVSRNFRWW
jgi:hypothetical protein